MSRPGYCRLLMRHERVAARQRVVEPSCQMDRVARERERATSCFVDRFRECERLGGPGRICLFPSPKKVPFKIFAPATAQLAPVMWMVVMLAPAPAAGSNLSNA